MKNYEEQRDLIKDLLKQKLIESMVITKKDVRIVKLRIIGGSELIYKGELATKIAIYILGA